MSFSYNSVIVFLLIFYFRILLNHYIDLRVKDELFSDNLEFVFVKLFNLSIIVTSHLLILLLKKRNVLKAALFIIKQGTNARFFLVLNNLFFQNFKLKLHEMNLLLEVANVLIFNALIGVLAKSSLTGFILTVELHWDSRLMSASKRRS